MQLTFNDHFQFGRLPDDEQTFIAQCGRLSRKPNTPTAEAILAAKLIYENSQNKKIQLCLSGGIDSECMLQSFIQAIVPFEIIFMKFKDDLNLFDIETNIQICEKLKLPFQIIELDVFHFFESGEYQKIAKDYECQSPQIAAHLWLLDQLDGIPVMAGNPIAPVWHNEKWFFVGLPGELHSTYFKYFMIKNKPGIPWFFMYTPELIASFFQLSCMQDYLNQKIIHIAQYDYKTKCQSYQEGGFQVAPRQDKFTGFEKIKTLYDQKANTKFGTYFNELYRKPLETEFPFPEKLIQLIPTEYFQKQS